MLVFHGTSMPRKSLTPSWHKAGRLTLPYTPEALAAWGGTAEQGRRQQEIWLQTHNEQASWSTLSHHELIADSDHYIQVSRPDAVVKGVTWVLERVPHTSN